MFAICYTKPGTTLTFWLNRFSWGGLIWSLVRSTSERNDQHYSQPPLRFATEAAARAFIDTQLGGNPDARVAQVED